MKKTFTLIAIGLLFLSCSNDDDSEIDCSLFDPAFPSLYIRIVDTTGTNLIENGTIDPDNISVEGDFSGAGYKFIPADESANPNADSRAFDNSLNLFIPHQSTFQYTIHLDNYKTIHVNFMVESTRIPCDITYFKPAKANFNTEELEVKEIFSLKYLAVIEL